MKCINYFVTLHLSYEKLCLCGESITKAILLNGEEAQNKQTYSYKC